MSDKKERNRGKAINTIVDQTMWEKLLKEYDKIINEKQLNEYGPHSNKKVWWNCEKGHSYDMSIHNRYIGSNCSYCSGRKVNESNCILATNPDVADEWDYSKNTVDITTVIAGSNKKYWWKCINEHEWETSPNIRIKKGSNCPHCTGRTTADGNTLAKKYPEIAKEWHPTKNTITPDKITPKSDKKVWWICPIKPEHEYETKISSRTSKRESGCPYCAGKKVQDDNSFLTHHPEIAKEWHQTKNEQSANEYSKTSGKKVWWKCLKNHEWESSISNRIKGHGCPYCSGRLASEEKNLAQAHPHLIKEWHPTKNKKKPEEYTPSSHSKVWWICSKNLKHEWNAKIANRTIANKTNCPKCNMSKLELETDKVLTNLNINFKREYIFDNLKQYRYDFFVPEWNTLIECDGEQHFTDDSKFYKAKTNAKSFKEQTKSDKEKDEYTLNNKINLVRIAYTEFNNIETIIKEYSKLDKTNTKIYRYPESLYTAFKIPNNSSEL